MIAEGRSINITLIFSLARYAQIIEAYLSGLEASSSGAATRRACTASRRSSSAGRHRGRPAAGRDRHRRGAGAAGPAAIAQAKLAYRLFREQFSGERWQRLAASGRARSGRCGPPPRPRTRPTPTPATSTS
jgi:transaldolase